MGRLRNLSASFKAAAFPTASSNAYKPDSTPDTLLVPDKNKDAPTIIREASAHSIPEASSSTPPRAGSLPYTPPTIVNDEIEELKPVFGYVQYAGKFIIF